MTPQNPLELLAPIALGIGPAFLFAALLLAAKRWAEPPVQSAGGMQNFRNSDNLHR